MFGLKYRRIEEEDNVNLEHDFSGGTAMYTKICGQVGSSTRMEVGVVLHALRDERPLHMALDNSTVVRKVNHIIWKKAAHDERVQGAYRGDRNEKGKPYSIVKDGDLWEVVDRAAYTRGRASVRITKTKGHATIQDVESGLSTWDQR